MIGVILLVPLILTRYVLLYIVDKTAFRCAAFFPPVEKGEKAAIVVYQISALLFVIYLCFLRVVSEAPWFISGLAVFGLGILLCLVSTLNYARPKGNGINVSGIYAVSRNPMYIAYFVYFLGCVLLTRSLLLFLILVILQVTTHWMIKSEERWCVNQFGDEYREYMKRVRRYF